MAFFPATLSLILCWGAYAPFQRARRPSEARRSEPLNRERLYERRRCEHGRSKHRNCATKGVHAAPTNAGNCVSDGISRSGAPGNRSARWP